MSENTQNTEPEVVPTFYVIVVNEFGPPQFLTFDSIEQAAASVREYKATGDKLYVYVVEGHQWRISKGDKNFLVSPRHDKRIALFDEEELQFNEDGSM